MENDHLNNEEIRLDVLRIVRETSTEYEKKETLKICEEYYKWIKGKTIRKNLTDKKE